MIKHAPNTEPEAATMGAHWDGVGVTFRFASRTAERVELCLFDGEDREHRVPMTPAGTSAGAPVWSAHVSFARPGQRYALRVHGAWAPRRGLFHNPHKLLLDPYAAAVSGSLRFHPSQTCWNEGDGGVLLPDARDSAAARLRSVVADQAFDWQDHHPPKVAWRDSVIYECHVKGMTARHPRVRDELRGTYLGLCAEPVIEHLRGLGVTTLCLMPLAASYTERRLVDAGLVNYWGYQPIACFAPTPLYAAVVGHEVTELKTMIRELHRAGIEVLLDVVLNHTGEGPSLGPAAGPLLGLRGIDPGYFRRDLDAETNSARLDLDYTGCGNTLDLSDPLCRQLVLDCFRHWASTYHVDGFRLDLAPVLGREQPHFNPHAPLWSALQQDPLLADLKWVAEPWDLGPGGYCLGRFPAPLREWNDRFREAARHYARGDHGARNELSTRLAGSADVFGSAGRNATSSINYITSHDGFTLRDLVSYSYKHNADNGEHNRDGRDHNTSHHWGVEGETDDPAVIETRRRVASALLVMLACAQGVPMLCHGDELGRTQRGNNNAYCQDGPLSHVDWQPDAFGTSLHTLVRALFSLRQERPALRVEHHCHGELVPGVGLPDLGWLGGNGFLQGDDWHDRAALPLGMLRCAAWGQGATSGADVVVAYWNPTAAATALRLPSVPLVGDWTVRIDTAPDVHVPRAHAGETVTLLPHGALVLTWDERA